MLKTWKRHLSGSSSSNNHAERVKLSHKHTVKDESYSVIVNPELILLISKGRDLSEDYHEARFTELPFMHLTS